MLTGHTDFYLYYVPRVFLFFPTSHLISCFYRISSVYPITNYNTWCVIPIFSIVCLFNDNITLCIYYIVYRNRKKSWWKKKVLPKINYHSAYNRYSVITNHDISYKSCTKLYYIDVRTQSLKQLIITEIEI